MDTLFLAGLMTLHIKLKNQRRPNQAHKAGLVVPTPAKKQKRDEAV